MKKYYRCTGDTAYEVLQTTEAFKDPRERAPSTVNHRYLTEDIPYGLTPISHLGEVARVGTPTIDSLIQLASVVKDIDFRGTGITLEKLGLTNKSLKQINQYLAKSPIW